MFHFIKFLCNKKLRILAQFFSQFPQILEILLFAPLGVGVEVRVAEPLFVELRQESRVLVDRRPELKRVALVVAAGAVADVVQPLRFLDESLVRRRRHKRLRLETGGRVDLVSRVLEPDLVADGHFRFRLRLFRF